MSRSHSVVLLLLAAAARAQEAPAGAPDASLDLRTAAGVAAVQGTWRTTDARFVPVTFPAPGPDRKPTGAPRPTLDVEPKAGGIAFDDAAWEVLAPEALDTRRGAGRVSAVWYRFAVTIPERIGGFATAGTTVVLRTVVDDYAEIWVDGQLPRTLDGVSPHLVQGWNRAHHVVIGRDVKPGQRIQLAVFGVNGPLSDPPPNYVWIRDAALLFFRMPRAVPPRSVAITVERHDAALDQIVPRDVRLEQLAEGFRFTEGPIWLPQGALLFSDPNANRIWRWSPTDGLGLFRDHSGYDAADIAAYGQPGSNGLTLDAEGRLTVCEHGRRRVTRTRADGTQEVLAERIDGKRLNSPNDLVWRSDGTLYFTDPPFGLPKFHDDPRRELPWFPVVCVKDGKVFAVATELRGPNGLAFTPDERFLYVANWDEQHKVVKRYPVHQDGTLGEGTVFFDMGKAPEPEALDGLKVDQAGNVYVSGPGGVWILAPDGRHLGTLRCPELPANFAWGDADGRTLYLTARTGLYRVRLLQPGIRPWPRAG